MKKEVTQDEDAAASTTTWCFLLPKWLLTSARPPWTIENIEPQFLFIYLFVSSAKALTENEEKTHTHTQKKVYSHALRY